MAFCGNAWKMGATERQRRLCLDSKSAISTIAADGGREYAECVFQDWRHEMMVDLSRFDPYLIEETKALVGYRAAPNMPVELVVELLHLNELQEDGLPMAILDDVPEAVLKEARLRAGKK